MNTTLWEIAKGFRSDANVEKLFGDSGDAAASAYEDAATQIEVWAKLMAKNYIFARDAPIKLSPDVLAKRVLEDVGVPEDELDFGE